MEDWLNPIQETAALLIALCALAPLRRHLHHPVVGLVMIGGVVATTVLAVLPASVDLALAVAVFGLIVVASRRRRLAAWLKPGLSGASTPSGEIAVNVAAHPVTGRLQVFHLSRWFDAILIDPANPPLREGETVYLIRQDGRQAWVSRVRSRTQPTASAKRWRLDPRYTEA